MSRQDQSPLEKIEALCVELANHYGAGEERELRVAAKLLLVSLDQFRRHGGHGWPSLVREYLSIAEYEAEKFEQILRSNRGEDR